MKFWRIALILLSFFGLIAIRFLGDDFFYNPLSEFFTATDKPDVPRVNVRKLIFHLSSRFALNSIFSLLILWAIFLRKDFLKYSIICLSAIFVIVTPLFIYELLGGLSHGNLGFYLRRFIIQPIGLLVLIPGLFFLKFNEN